MKVLVTGASGYVGQAVVADLLSRGHDVRAIVRNGDVQGAEVVRGDLTEINLSAELAGIDAIIHAAAKMSGDEAEMARDTVDATRLLLTAAAHANVPRVVLVSSMSVYGADCPPHSIIDEDSPLEALPDQRDGYTRAKLAQEAAALEALQDTGVQLWVMRVGAVFGPHRLWNGHLGVAKGPLLVRMAAAGEIPLAYIHHVASALSLAAETEADGVEIVNVVDDDRPDRIKYTRALKQGGWPKITVPVSWRLLSGIGRVLSFLPLPGLLRGPVLRARMMPLSYSNDRLKQRLGWQPSVSFGTAMARSLKAEQA